MAKVCEEFLARIIVTLTTVTEQEQEAFGCEME